VKGNIS